MSRWMFHFRCAREEQTKFDLVDYLSCSKILAVNEQTIPTDVFVVARSSSTEDRVTKTIVIQRWWSGREENHTIVILFIQKSREELIVECDLAIVCYYCTNLSPAAFKLIFQACLWVSAMTAGCHLGDTTFSGILFIRRSSAVWLGNLRCHINAKLK